MSNFSSFILSESLSNKQIIALHRFNELFKTQVTLELSETLYKAWSKTIAKANVKIDSQLADEAKVINSKAITDIVVSNLPIRLSATSELGKTYEVSPSIKLPFIIPQAERKLLIESLLKTSSIVFSDIINIWSEAFMFEKSGRLHTDFKIRHTSKGVRLSLVSSDGNHEKETIIYYVSIEYGKQGSKLKAFDTLYLGIST